MLGPVEFEHRLDRIERLRREGWNDRKQLQCRGQGYPTTPYMRCIAKIIGFSEVCDFLAL